MREITRVVRQICLLAEIDRESEASRVTSAVLNPLVDRYRGAHGPDSLPDERLREIRLREEERARDAAALGEMLVPLLARHLEALSRAAGRTEAAPAATAPSADAGRSRPRLSPEIADLLDGMLAQEGGRPPARPRRSQAKVLAPPSLKPTNPSAHP